MDTNEWVTGNVVLKIHGQPLEMQMTVPAKPVKPQRMLPVFHQMANAFVGMSVDAVEAAGKKISCKAGCGACCRQAVPLAEIEAYQLAELVAEMPEPRQSIIRKRFADACEHFSKTNWFQRIKDTAELPHPKNPDYISDELAAVVMQYFNEGIPCPFLEDESCSIHELRPVACREYLVTSPAENCARPTARTIKMMKLLIKPSRSLREVGRTDNSRGLGVLPLIRALEFVEKYPENFAEKTGERWVADFFGELTKTDISENGIEATPIGKKVNKRKVG